MSQEKNNRKTILLGALVIVALIGVCFFCVTLYAKKEINKPKFIMPEQPELPSLTDQLTDKDAVFAFAEKQYADTISADNAECSWRTDLRLDGDWQTPFSDADQAILMHIRDNAGGQLASFYPKAENVRMTEAKDVPQFNRQASDVLDYDFMIGRYNGDGDIVDTNRYFLTLTFDPNSEDTMGLTDSETFRKIRKELSPVADISDVQIEVKSLSMCFVFDRISEELLSVDVMRDLIVSADVRLNDDSAALLAQQDCTLVLPYGTTQKIEFRHYGANFSIPAIAVKPGDIKALPADVRVQKDASKSDYTLTFVSSDPEALTFDEDGVMTVGKKVPDDPVTVTMTLEYEGHTYTDELIVYISEWEVATDVGA